MSHSFHGVSQSLLGQFLGGCVIACAMPMGSGFMCVGSLRVKLRQMRILARCHSLLLLFAGSYDPCICSFLRWIITSGESEASSLSYAPLPQALADKVLKSVYALP
jgi:hypothetical protein